MSKGSAQLRPSAGLTYGQELIPVNPTLVVDFLLSPCSSRMFYDLSPAAGKEPLSRRAVLPNPLQTL